MTGIRRRRKVFLGGELVESDENLKRGVGITAFNAFAKGRADLLDDQKTRRTSP